MPIAAKVFIFGRFQSKTFTCQNRRRHLFPKWWRHTDGQWKLQSVEVMEKGSVNRLNHVIPTISQCNSKSLSSRNTSVLANTVQLFFFKLVNQSNFTVHINI